MAKDTKNIIRELVEEVIEEMTSTGAVAGYQTPNAFGKNPSKKKDAARSMPGGQVVGDIETDSTTVGEGERLTMRRELEEGRSRYRNFKESDMMKNHAKVSYGIREAKKMLGEVEYLLNICERLKTEAGIPKTNLWARTQPDMKEIHVRLKKIANRIHNMGKK